MTACIRLLAIAVAFALGATVAAPPPDPKAVPPAGAAMGIATDPAPPGTVPWQLLMQAKTVQKPNKKFGPEFTKEIRELDRKEVKLYGFMMPLDNSQKQKRFLLSPYPPHCAFCMPGGPEALVEVVCDKAVDFTYEPVVVSGRMSVLDDEMVYYRLTNAGPAK